MKFKAIPFQRLKRSQLPVSIGIMLEETIWFWCGYSEEHTAECMVLSQIANALSDEENT